MDGKFFMAGNPGEAAAQKTADTAFLAGGTEINRLGSLVHAEGLISLKHCKELKQIEKNGGEVRIGSMCTFQDVLESEEVPGWLKEAAAYMGSRTKRNMATIGGNIALLRSDSYIVPALLAADSCLSLLMPDGSKKEEALWTYLQQKKGGDLENALIISVTVPADAVIASKRYSNTVQSHAVLTVSAGCGQEGVRLAAGIKNAGLFRLAKLEETVNANPDISEEEIIQWCRDCKAAEIKDDMFGSEDYKRYLLGVTISKLLAEVKR